MPLYEYRHCGDVFETSRKVSDRGNVKCPACGQKADRIITYKSKPVFYEYYDDGLGAHVTGPGQRKRLMKEKGLEESG